MSQSTICVAQFDFMPAMTKAMTDKGSAIQLHTKL